MNVNAINFFSSSGKIFSVNQKIKNLMHFLKEIYLMNLNNDFNNDFNHDLNNYNYDNNLNHDFNRNFYFRNSNNLNNWFLFFLIFLSRNNIKIFNLRLLHLIKSLIFTSSTALLKAKIWNCISIDIFNQNLKGGLICNMH